MRVWFNHQVIRDFAPGHVGLPDQDGDLHVFDAMPSAHTGTWIETLPHGTWSAADMARTGVCAGPPDMECDRCRSAGGA